MKRITPLLSVLLPLALAACSTSTISGDGYRHPDFPLTVRSAAPNIFVNDSWQTVRASRHGARDQLTLEHRRTGTRMWVGAFALSNAMRERELSSLADEATTYIRRSGYRGQGGGTVYNGGRGAGGTYHGGASYTVGPTLDVVNQADMQLAGVPARAVLMANDDVHAALVFARIDVEQVQTRRSRIAPVLIVAGLAASPTDFEEALPDFTALLQQVSATPAP